MTQSSRDRSNALNAVATLHDVLRQIGWDSSPVDSEGVFSIDLRSPDLPVSDALAAIAVESERLIFYLNLASHAPVERREEVARLIGLINWQLSIGNFEMDVTDGHIRFRSSIDFANVPLEAQLVRNHILDAMRAMEVYGEAMLRVIEGDADALRAFTGIGEDVT
jgi:hypothetical protein